MSDFAEGMRVQRELEDANQTQLMHFYDGLSQEEKLTLEEDLKNLEIDQLDHMFKGNHFNRKITETYLINYYFCLVYNHWVGCSVLLDGFYRGVQQIRTMKIAEKPSELLAPCVQIRTT